jgi:hypothetical protein
METYEQPLSQEHREQLEGVVAFSAHLFRVLLFTGCILLIGIGLRSLQHLLFSTPPLWLILTLLLAFWLYRRSSRWTGGKAMRSKICQDLDMGRETVKVVTPSCVEKAAEEEDEGPTYIIETDDGGTYLFCGQSLIEYEDMGFPWARIGVVEAPISGRLLGLECLGNPIPVNRYLSPFSYTDARKLGCFQTTFVVLNEAQLALLNDHRARVGRLAT